MFGSSFYTGYFFSCSNTPQRDTVSDLFSTLWFFLVCIYVSTTRLIAIHAEYVYLWYSRVMCSGMCSVNQGIPIHLTRRKKWFKIHYCADRLIKAYSVRTFRSHSCILYHHCWSAHADTLLQQGQRSRKLWLMLSGTTDLHWLFLNGWVMAEELNTKSQEKQIKI